MAGGHTPGGERWLTLTESAARASVSRSTLYRARAAGRLPFLTTASGLVRIVQSDLDGWVLDGMPTGDGAAARRPRHPPR
jgi:excisionase family DNA binding protein